MTGSNADGTLMSGFTCADWSVFGGGCPTRVSHSDSMGRGKGTAGALASWNSAPPAELRRYRTPRAGRIYCFAR
jgi:hypothetical protein